MKRTFFLKVSIVLGWINFILLFVYPIAYSVIREDDMDGMMLGFAIIFGQFILFAVVTAVLMALSHSELSKKKLCRHVMTCAIGPSLSSCVHTRLLSSGYVYTNNLSFVDGSYVYQKKRIIRNDLFIIHHTPYDTKYCVNIFNQIEEIKNGIILLCIENISNKEIRALTALSKENIFGGYLVAVLDISKKTLYYDKMTDGYAPLRHHLRIKLLKSIVLN